MRSATCVKCERRQPKPAADYSPETYQECEYGKRTAVRPTARTLRAAHSAMAAQIMAMAPRCIAARDGNPPP